MLFNTQLETSISKSISKQFSRAASKYDSAAQLQLKVIDCASNLLLERLSFETNKAFQILDIGCGTSNLLAQLEQKLAVKQFNQCIYTGVDIAPGMLAYSADKFAHLKQSQLAKWQIENAESLSFEQAQFDFVFSSLAWQWCDLTKVISEAYRVLKPGGALVFTTLLDGTLNELNQAYRVLDDKSHVNRFLNRNEFNACIDSFEWQDKQLSFVNQPTYYSSVYELLKELKSVGANTVLANHSSLPLNKQRLAQLELLYPKHHEQHKQTIDKPVSASWQLAYCSLIKPANN